jgi:hypothetical protein
MDDYLDFVFTKPILSLFCGLLLLIVGLFLLGVPQSVASNDWFATEGVVISSKLQEECCNSYTEGWYPRVIYRYSVNRHEYTSDKIHFVDLGSLNTDYYSRETIRKYPVGKKVMVYFNPDNPFQAILELGPAAEAILPALILMMMGVIPITVRLVSLRFLRLTRRGQSQENGSGFASPGIRRN